MKKDRLNDTFRKLCSDLTKRSDVLYTEFTKEKRADVYTIYFRAVKIQLVYCRRWEVIAPPSVLFCRICFSKAERAFIHLPELIAHLGRDDYRACYFPYLETPERMECAFHALWNILEEYIPIAESMAISEKCDELIRKSHWENFFDDKAKPEPVPEDEVLLRHALEDVSISFESLMVGRHSDLDAYQEFLRGNWSKALKKYRKMEKSGLSAYERGLCRFMEDPANRGFEPMPPECSALEDYKKHQVGFHDLWGLLFMWLPLCVLMCGVLAVGNWYYAQETLFCFGMPLWFGLIMASFPALFGYATFQRQILKVLKQKKAMEFCALTETNHPLMNRIMPLLFAASLILCLGFMVQITGECERFYGDHAICLDDAGEYTRFEYSDVEAVYYINSRYNDFGGRVERGSYVIVLDDGSCYDLDSNLYEKDQKLVIDTLFSDEPLIVVDSDRDLP